MSARSGPRESTLVRQIMAALRATPGVVVRKRHGSGWSVAGDPDLYGSFRGRHFELEVKCRDGVVIGVQQARLRDWARAGALVGIARSVGEALSVLGLSASGSPK
jgi:hypothetical protein